MDSPVINSDAVIPIAAEEIVHLPPPPAIEGNWGGIPIVVEPVPNSTSATARNSIDQQRLRELRTLSYTHLDLPPPGSAMMRYTEPVIRAEENNSNIIPFIETDSEIRETSHRVMPNSAFHDNERGMDELQHWNDLSPVEFTRIEPTTTIAREAENTHLSMDSFRTILQNKNFEDDTRLVIGIRNTIERRPMYENEADARHDYSALVDSFVRALGTTHRFHFSTEQEAEARANGLTRNMIRIVFNSMNDSTVDHIHIQRSFSLSSSSSSPVVSDIESEVDDTETQISQIEKRFNFIIEETKRRITSLHDNLHVSAWAAAYPELRELAEAALRVVVTITNTDEKFFKTVHRATSLAVTVASIASRASILANPEASKNAKIVSKQIKSDIFILLNPIFSPTQRNIPQAVTLAKTALTTANNAMRSIDSNREFNRITELTRLSSIATAANRQENTGSASAAALDVATNHLGAKNVLISRPLASAAIFLEQAANTEDSQENSDSDISDDSWMEEIGK